VAYLTRAVDVQDSAARWTDLVARPLDEGNQSPAIRTGSLKTIDVHRNQPYARRQTAMDCGDAETRELAEQWLREVRKTRFSRTFVTRSRCPAPLRLFRRAAFIQSLAALRRTLLTPE
jgi:hypothetical protein